MDAPKALPDIAAWLDAPAAHDGVAAAALRELRARLASASDRSVWIEVVDADALERRLRALQAIAASAGSRAALLRERPLLGVPFAVKDNIDVAGLPTTAACLAHARIAKVDAHAVARLLEAGAVCMGKTNLDQFATGLVGTRSPFGRPASVADPARVSGGSSSGSAVAVARGDVPFALGTDTAGSGRVPAAFNGIVGLKPTPGRVGTSGVVPACRSLDCVSVFATRAVDAARVLAVVEGEDPGDAYGHLRRGPARWPSRVRVGVPRAPDLDASLGYDRAFARACATLAEAGHEVVPVDMAPLDAVAALLYDGPWVAERLVPVEAWLHRDPQAFDPVVRRILERARDLSAVDAFRGLHALQARRRDAEALWQRVDLLMAPTAPTHPTFAQVDADPIGANARLGTYTNFVNLLGWCAIAMPAGRADGSLPFGVTFVAPADRDAALARFACAWSGEPVPSSAPWPGAAPTVALAVVGAHLSGLPLNAQLVERGATLAATTRTAAAYRLHALPGMVPPKPGLVRVAQGGASIAVEVWDVPEAVFGSIVALVPAPLCIGQVELDDGRQVHGFLCEAHAVADALDITAHGGWKAWLAASGSAPASPPTREAP